MIFISVVIRLLGQYHVMFHHARTNRTTRNLKKTLRVPRLARNRRAQQAGRLDRYSKPSPIPCDFQPPPTHAPTMLLVSFPDQPPFPSTDERHTHRSPPIPLLGPRSSLVSSPQLSVGTTACPACWLLEVSITTNDTILISFSFLQKRRHLRSEITWLKTKVKQRVFFFAGEVKQRLKIDYSF